MLCVRCVLQAKEAIDNFRQYSQLFADACNPAMQLHHWAQMFTLMGQEPPGPNAAFSVNDLLAWGIQAHAEVGVSEVACLSGFKCSSSSAG